MYVLRMLMPLGSFDSVVYGATMILIYAKLSDLLDWSWIWIFAPFWGAVTAAFLVAILTALGFGLPQVWPIREHTDGEGHSPGQ